MGPYSLSAPPIRPSPRHACPPSRAGEYQKSLSLPHAPPWWYSVSTSKTARTITTTKTLRVTQLLLITQDSSLGLRMRWLRGPRASPSSRACRSGKLGTEGRQQLSKDIRVTHEQCPQQWASLSGQLSGRIS